MRIGLVVFSSESGVIYGPFIRGLLIIGVYAPYNQETKGTDVQLSILDRAAIMGYGTIIVIGDLNTKACASGSPPRS